MAEQSHKREMNEAVRGDFERLRARHQRRTRPDERPAASPERIVLTPPPRSTAEPDRPPVEQPPERRSWLRSLRRRG